MFLPFYVGWAKSCIFMKKNHTKGILSGMISLAAPSSLKLQNLVLKIGDMWYSNLIFSDFSFGYCIIPKPVPCKRHPLALWYMITSSIALSPLYTLLSTLSELDFRKYITEYLNLGISNYWGMLLKHIFSSSGLTMLCMKCDTLIEYCRTMEASTPGGWICSTCCQKNSEWSRKQTLGRILLKNNASCWCHVSSLSVYKYW